MRVVIILLFWLIGVSCGWAQIPTTNVADSVPVKIIVRSVGPGQGTLSYSVNNLNWTNDLTDVKASIWGLSNGSLIRVDERGANFIARGEFVAREHIATPVLVGKFVACVSYQAGDQRFDVLSFYSNENHSSFQLQIGELTKFHSPVVETDGTGNLCNDMPNSAMRYLN